MGATHDHASVQPEAQQQRSSCTRDCHEFFVLPAIIVSIQAFLVAMSYLLAQAFNQEPHYSVAIGHVSGLDPTADLHHGTALEPEFNLTLRVASWGIWATECAEPRMYATVSYRGVALAASATLTQQICAGPMEAVDYPPLVARGEGVVVPGPLLDSLAMDMRSGVPEFDVELHGPGPRNMAWQCGPRRVGDAAALQMECPL